MKAKKLSANAKKVLVLCTMVALLIVTGTLNFVLNDKLTSPTDGTDVVTTSETFFTSCRAERETARAEEFSLLEAILTSDTSTEELIASANEKKLELIDMIERELVLEGLIKALDDVLAQDAGRYIEYYKFPKSDYYDEAITRHDPVTIYLSARNRDIEQNIVRAVAPYARSNEGLLGEILGYGVDISPETTQKYGMSVGQVVGRQIYAMLKNYNR